MRQHLPQTPVHTTAEELCTSAEPPIALLLYFFFLLAHYTKSSLSLPQQQLDCTISRVVELVCSPPFSKYIDNISLQFGEETRFCSHLYGERAKTKEGLQPESNLTGWGVFLPFKAMHREKKIAATAHQNEVI